MNKLEAIGLLKRHMVSAWSSFRSDNPTWDPDLSHLNLGKIKLYDFDLSGANLCGTDLTQAIFTHHGSRKFSHATLRNAIFNSDTRFPEGIDPGKFGARYVSQPLPTEIRTVFISYGWEKKEIIDAIDAWLGLRGIRTILDRRDFVSGARIADEIYRTMRICECILVFTSQETKDKPWLEFERNLATDLNIEAKQEGETPPRLIYVILDDSQIPTGYDKHRLAIMARGKSFPAVCEEIYHSIMEIPRNGPHVDLDDWTDYIF